MSRVSNAVRATLTTDPPMPSGTLDTALQALLAEYPDAHVAAIGDDGLFAPVPQSVRLHEHRVLRVRSMLDLAIPEERELVLHTWERVRASGASSAQLHLRVAPDRVTVIHFLDARPRHGVYIGVLVGAGGDAVPDLRTIPPSPPRIARVRKNELAVFTGVDEAITQLLGWTAADLAGHRSLEFIHPDDQERAVQSWMQMLSEPDRLQPAVRLRHRRSDGSWAWFEVTNHNRLADGVDPHVLAEMIDISDEMAAQEALEAREQLLHRLAEALPIGVFQVLADGRIAYTNARLRGILGVGPAATVEAQLATISRDDWPSVEAALDAALRSGIDADLEVQVQPSEEARTRRCTLRLRPLTDRQGAVSGAVVCVEDVTASVQLRDELERRASHDLLTRLLNRASVLAALEGALASQGRSGIAAIFIDLDNFKGVNDRLGHLAGDELLRTVADRLAITVRGGDPLGRTGGDEFLVVCPSMGGPKPALDVAERIAHALRQPIRLAGATLELRASVGVAYTRRPVRADLLVQHADAAMYCSKRHGEGRPVMYSHAIAHDGPTDPETRRTTSRQSLPSAPQRRPSAANGRPSMPVARPLD
jgi:diguanylate cyclase (GGDEF)-like protein/PAS domain S-box-containing protein